MRSLLFIFRLIMVSLFVAHAQIALGATAGKAYLVEVDGTIGPASQELIVRAIHRAEDDAAAMVILQLNTPGGLDHSMREIIRTILDSHVPVITYVSPQGSRAASAGTYILYASHIAAMAPATNLGAATPVQIGGLSPGTGKEGDGETAMERKITNDAVAYIKGLAKLRGRNAVWAEQAVRKAASLTADEALEKHVIDIIAPDLNSLLKQLDGRQINIKGRTVILHTDNLVIEHVRPDWRSDLLGIITDPNVAYVLMLVGIYGLILEFASPGSVLPGTVGTISLLLALYAFQVLPINFAGLALVCIGIAFIVSEMFVTSGVIGAGGVVAFTIGSIMLFDDKYLAISMPLIGGTALVAGGFMLWILKHFSSLRHKQVVSGAEYMIGRSGKVVEDFTGRGRVQIDGESWLADSPVPLSAGQRVRVKAIDKLVLKIEPADEPAREE
jgi:membrane-bound serine protease (ClpP class)